MLTAIWSFALNLGASIFSTSSLWNKNLLEITKYILHWSSGHKFFDVPEIWDRERIIIPTGYDSPDLIK